MTGVYLHVPFCAKKCPYCDFYSCGYTKSAADAYTEAVCRNLAALPQNLEVDTVYFGGGTPSLLSDAAVSRILNAAAKRCHLYHPEITLEANPRTMTEEKLCAWKRAGINRLSVGIQSFQDEILTVLGRNHTAKQGMDAIFRAAAAGFENLSLDLMLGLSLHTEAMLEEEIRMAVSMPVTHISVYLLKIEDGTPYALETPDLLDEDNMAERYLYLHDRLTEEGFLHYEISNFAKQGYESRHNCKYWRCEPYYGIGPAAHSCYQGKRFAVPRDLSGFCAHTLQPTELTDDNPCSAAERIMLGMRLSDGISLSDFPDCRETLLRHAKPLIPKYLRLEGERLMMTPEGWLLSNSVLVSLMRGIL